MSILVPNSDNSIYSWIKSGGGTPIYPSIDETIASLNTSDYIYTNFSGYAGFIFGLNGTISAMPTSVILRVSASALDYGTDWIFRFATLRNNSFEIIAGGTGNSTIINNGDPTTYEITLVPNTTTPSNFTGLQIWVECISGTALEARIYALEVEADGTSSSSDNTGFFSQMVGH